MLTDGVLTLRPPGEADVEALLAAAGDPEIPRWTNVPSPYRREHALEFVHRDHPRIRGFVGYADGRFAGTFSLIELDPAERYTEIGYWVAAPMRRRGLATRAVVLLRDYAVRELGIERVRMLIDPANVASLRVAKGAGFKPTGATRMLPHRGVPRTFTVLGWVSPAD